MADHIYLLTLPQSARGTPLVGGAESMIVYAETANDAKAIAKSQYGSDSDTSWDSATVTDLVATTTLEGLRFVIGILFAAGVTTEFAYTAKNTDTYDNVIDALVVLLNASASIAAASNQTGGVLRIGAGDNLGAKVMSARVEYNGIAIPGLAPVVDVAASAGTKRDFTYTTTLKRPAVLAACKVVV